MIINPTCATEAPSLATAILVRFFLAATSLASWLRAQETVPSAPAATTVTTERAHQADCVVLHEVTGPIRTNAYLLYDRASREAALIDVGGPIESLTTAIDRRGLRLKYIFTTHGHVDHVQGMPALRVRYLEARWCISRMEVEDLARYAQWETALPPDSVARIKAGMTKDPAMAATFRFDFARLGAPDEFIGDGQVFHLGCLSIHAVLCPGHSRGSVCFVAGDAVFSGDVLFYRRIGTTSPGLAQAEGRSTLEASVHRLYAMLTDETTVYPGHGHFTEIGIEKLHNEQIKAASSAAPPPQPTPQSPQVPP